jgi:hypothetical protein
MTFERGYRWFQRPGPTILVGIVALGIGALGAVFWLRDGNELWRLIGLVGGASGVWLTVGAVISIRERRSR